MSVAVVVVSYNRKELLRSCLNSVCRQVDAADEVIVVDNGSTDGAPDMVRSEFPQCTIFETGENLGGSGGFAWGVELAIAKRHDWAWLMDDDGTPKPDALGILKKTVNRCDEEPSFVACLVSGTPGSSSTHPPVLTLEADTERILEASRLDCIAVSHAIFVGVMINLHIAQSLPLPRRDFFIWLDDLEYTSRLNREAIGLLVPSSQISHPIKPADHGDMGARLFYFTRNNLWCTKLGTQAKGLRSSLPAMSSYLLVYGIRQFFKAKDKKVWISSLSRGLYQGIVKNPRTDMPGDLLRSSKKPVPARPQISR